MRRRSSKKTEEGRRGPRINLIHLVKMFFALTIDTRSTSNSRAVYNKQQTFTVINTNDRYNSIGEKTSTSNVFYVLYILSISRRTEKYLGSMSILSITFLATHIIYKRAFAVIIIVIDILSNFAMPQVSFFSATRSVKYRANPLC